MGKILRFREVELLAAPRRLGAGDRGLSLDRRYRNHRSRSGICSPLTVLFLFVYLHSDASLGPSIYCARITTTASTLPFRHHHQYQKSILNYLLHHINFAFGFTVPRCSAAPRPLSHLPRRMWSNTKATALARYGNSSNNNKLLPLPTAPRTASRMS